MPRHRPVSSPVLVVSFASILSLGSVVAPTTTLARPAIEGFFLGYPVGNNPHSVAVADLDGDATLDAVVANEGADSITLFHGSGDGTFTFVATRATADAPESVVPVDLDLDGDLDLVVTAWYSNVVSVYLNDGPGTFASRTDIPAGTAPFFAAAGFLDGDAIPDLAVANDTGGGVSVLIGHGDGSFAAPVTSATGAAPYGVAVRDLDDDGRPEIIVGNAESNTISVLPGTTDWENAPHVDYGTGGNAPQLFALGDVNGDGHDDLVVPYWGSHQITILPGAGDGTFGSATAVITSFKPVAVAIGDFDEDGHADLVSSGQENATLDLHRGLGDGTFAAAAPRSATSRATQIVTADVDQDGHLDILSAGYNAHILMVHLGNGDGTFGVAPGSASVPSPMGFEGADLNEDGAIDLVAAQNSPSGVGWARGNGDATFQPGVSTPSGAWGQNVATGDLDEDGHLDVVQASVSMPELQILLGSGNGSLGAPSASPTVLNDGRVELVDINEDGHLDALLTPQTTGGPIVRWLPGDGSGHFGAPVDVGASMARGEWVRAAHLDGDGHLDLIAGLSNHPEIGIQVFKGIGGGLFAAPVGYAGYSNTPCDLVDLTGDGALDFVSLKTNQSLFYVFANNGNGAFTAGSGIGGGLNPYLAHVGDVTRDGHPDILIQQYTNVPSAGILDVHAGRGDGTFERRYGIGIDGFANNLRVLDLNGDANPELVTAHPGQNRLQIRLNRPVAVSGIPGPSRPGQAWFAARPDAAGRGAIFQIELPELADVRVTIVDVLGRRLADPVDRSLEAGLHEFTWSGLTTSGHRVAPGVYFARAVRGDAVAAARFVLLRR